LTWRAANDDIDVWNVFDREPLFDRSWVYDVAERMRVACRCRDVHLYRPYRAEAPPCLMEALRQPTRASKEIEHAYRCRPTGPRSTRVAHNDHSSCISRLR
jgi:hypothetical protein